MKDEITIGLNGKTIASFGIELKGRGINVKSIGSFVVSTGSDEGNDVMNIRMGCILETLVEEKKVTPIEPMVVQPLVVEKKLPTSDEIVTTPLFTPAKEDPKVPVPTYNEIPIKTRKPRGPNKPKEEVVEKSVFDKPKEDIAKAVEEIEKKGEFVPIEDAAKELKIKAPVVERVVEKKEGAIIETVKIPIVKAPTVSTPTTPARVNELGKLIKMWSKASGLGIDYVTVERLKAEAFDIVENDSDETIVSGIGEAKRLIKV